MRLKGNLKRISGNSLGPLGVQNEAIGGASHALNRGQISPKTQATYIATSYHIKVLLKRFHLNCYINQFCSESYMALLLTVGGTVLTDGRKPNFHVCVQLFVIDCFLFSLFFSEQYYEEPKLYTRVLDGFNIGFTAVFLLECILKLIAFKPKVLVIVTVVQSHYKRGGESGESRKERKVGSNRGYLECIPNLEQQICSPGTDLTCVALTRGDNGRNSVGSIIYWKSNKGMDRKGGDEKKGWRRNKDYGKITGQKYHF